MVRMRKERTERENGIAPPGRARGARLLGPLLLGLLAGGCVMQAGGSGPYEALKKFGGKNIDAVIFRNAAPFGRDTLLALTMTLPTRCNFLGLPICLPLLHVGQERHTFDATVLQQDVQRLELFYRAAGYFGTQVTPSVAARGSDGVAVTFTVLPGDPVLLDTLTVTGLSGIVDPDSLARRLPLQPGQLFDVNKFLAAADTVRGVLLARGHAYAQVLRNYGVDTVRNRATAEIDAIPGPRVRIDSILVIGARHLGRTAVLRQVTARPGEYLQLPKLVESQRNLYGLDIVQIATVGIAPDSLQQAPQDSSRATIAARIVEAPEHQVEAALGFGSVECLRTEESWVDRSLGGGARRLEINGSVSKIGIGTGLGGNLCSAYAGDLYSSRLDYQLSTQLTQPFFLTPTNHLSLTVYAQRQSAPKVYQRTAQGARTAVAHRLSTREALTSSISLERSHTDATPVVYCIALQACERSLVDSLSQARWRNMLGTEWLRDRTNAPLSPTAGYVARLSLEWSARWLGSRVRFVRLTGNVNYYLTLSPGYVLAADARFGSFFRGVGLTPGQSFLSPEDRFYTGGATSVRGFGQPLLGPIAYVADTIRIGENDKVLETYGLRSVPTGGTAMGVANLELRTPSPFLAGRVRWAFFVDGGAVGSDPLWSLGAHDWRFTPGAGVRVSTPVGPIRLDVAYNPYPPTSGPLFLITPAGNQLSRFSDSFRPPTDSFWRRLHFNLAVGQPF